MVTSPKMPAIVVLQPTALSLAKRIADHIAGKVHGPKASGAAAEYNDLAPHLRSLFADGHPVITICATGILVRILANSLVDKTVEPPVIAIAEDGSAIVPILGGHNGANRLAAEIATITGGTPAITTASDIAFGIALDDPPPGHVLANREDVKPFVTRLLAGAEVEVDGNAVWLETALSSSLDLPAQSRKSQTGATKSHHSSKGGRSEREGVQNGKLSITVTTAPFTGSPDRLVYHPKTLALGVGCERGAKPADLIAHVETQLASANITPHAIAVIASIDLKSDEAAIHALSCHLDVPARFFTANRLNAESPRLANPSDTVMAEVGCPGVAEGAALAAVGPQSRLIVQKSVCGRTTCAVAAASEPIIDLPGKPQGRLFVVGIGPGTPDWRSPQAIYALEKATDWVGYELYIDLVTDLHHNQSEHRFPLGGEEDRVRRAINLATEGREVALICSGDAGIYAMAALVYEILDLEPQRIAVDVIPGISAFQAAAARAGALIGHDFCCISLSDLLTPWDVIEQRLKVAAEGDFVVALYNPRSLTRTTQLRRAIEILTPFRPPHTPVTIASSLGRPDETVRIVPLKEFRPEDVDMLTVVLIGASQSKSLTRGDGRTYAYTPRGYASKRPAT